MDDALGNNEGCNPVRDMGESEDNIDDAEDDDELAFTMEIVWKRWLLFGPLVLGCLLVIFLAGPSANQEFYYLKGGQAPPSHRLPTHIEEKHAMTMRAVDIVETWSKVRHAVRSYFSECMCVQSETSTAYSLCGFTLEISEQADDM